MKKIYDFLLDILFSLIHYLKAFLVIQLKKKNREWLNAWHPGEFDGVDTIDAFNMLATRNMDLFEEYKEEII